jgi:two-component system response regulator DevR
MGDAAKPAGQIGVFLLDDHEIVRRGVHDLLEAEPGHHRGRRGGDRRGGAGPVPAIKPDVAILDVRLPDGDGVSVCREIRSRMPEVAA